MKKQFLFTLLFFGLSFLGYSQKTISGQINDSSGQSLAGVNVLEKGTSNGASTDFEGKFSLTVKSDESKLIIKYLGFKTTEIKVSDNMTINLEEEGVGLEEVNIQAVGSRNTKRTVVNSAVPVDVINMADIVSKTGQVEVSSLLQYLAPSFNASKQSGSDGADHIDPATLRGLGPDQTLVLINGKRRHQSSLVNLFGSRGRGNTGTDMNAIPAAAIKRIEISVTFAGAVHELSVEEVCELLLIMTIHSPST